MSIQLDMNIKRIKNILKDIEKLTKVCILLNKNNLNIYQSKKFIN